MKTICLKFPDKVTAHGLLYGTEGEPLYQNVADYDRTGLCVRLVETDEGNYFTWPEDGSYCADVRDSRYADSVPEVLQPYVITPNAAYQKHKYAGE